MRYMLCSRIAFGLCRTANVPRTAPSHWSIYAISSTIYVAHAATDERTSATYLLLFSIWSKYGAMSGELIMIWIFAAVALYLAVTHEEFRKVVLWTAGIGSAAFVLFLIITITH